MSTVITVWGWFQMGRLTQYKVKVNIETFRSFMETLDEVYKADVQWYEGSRSDQRIILVQQLSNWTGWDKIKLAMEIAKAHVIVAKGVRKLHELTKPQESFTVLSSDSYHNDDLPF